MLTAKFIALGFEFLDESKTGNEIWFNSNTNKMFNIKNSAGVLSEKEILDILKQVGITAEEFLEI